MKQFIAFIWLIVLLVGCDAGSTPQDRIQQTNQGAQAGAISANGQWSVLADLNNQVVVWDNINKGLRYRWQLPDSANHPIYLIDTSPDSQFAVTAGTDRFAIWSLVNGQSQGFYQIDKSRIRDIALANNGTRLVYGRSDGVAVYVNLQTGRRLEFLGHSEQINAVAISPNGRYALTGGNDYRAYLWNTQTGQIVYAFTHGGRVTQVALDQQGTLAFTADSMDEAAIWSLKTGKQQSRLHFTARQRLFSSVHFSNDDRYLLTGSPSRLLALWDTANGQCLQQWRVGTAEALRSRSAVVYDTAFSGTDILSVSSAGLTERWSVNTAK